MKKENIVDHIINRAKSEAERKLKITKRVVERSDKMLKTRVKEITSVSKKELEGDSRQKRMQIIGQAKMEAKRKILTTKTKIMDDIFSDVIENSKNLPRNDRYLHLLTELTLIALKNIPGNRFVISLNEQDKEFLLDREKEFIKNIKSKTDKKNIDLKISDKCEKIIAGLIVYTENRKVRYVNSLEDILARNWSDYLMKIIKDKIDI